MATQGNIIGRHSPQELENMGYMRLGPRNEGCNFIVTWKKPDASMQRRGRNYASFPAALKFARARAARYGRAQVQYRCGYFSSREQTFSARRMRNADLVVTCRKVDGRVVCVTSTPKGKSKKTKKER